MDLLYPILLGIIQGLTEFLPVSSSGHLEIAQAILGEGNIYEESLLMTVVLHFATALATMVYFRKDIYEIIKGSWSTSINESNSYVLKILVSMIPAAIVGIAFEDHIESLFKENIVLVGIMLLITGALLLFADRAKTTQKDVSYLDSLFIGISQAIAILPGISRSGATISTSTLLGVDREKAAKFSFLMVVPLIFGKMAKDVLDGGLNINDTGLFSLGVGFLAAFITGYFACKWMIGLVKQAQLKYFAYYCFIVGSLALLYTTTIS